MEFRNLRIKEIGYEPLSDFKKWTQIDHVQKEGVMEFDGATTTLKKDYKNYVLRLEWLRRNEESSARVGLRGDFAASVRLGGDENTGSIPEAGVKVEKKHDNPSDQWNYLEVRVENGKARVWVNGTVVADGVDLKKVKDLPASGAIALKSELNIRFRNVRIKELKD